MKRALLLLLCLACALALLLAGCGEPNSGAGTETKGELPTNEEGKKIITIGMPVSALVLDINTNSYTLWLEEYSGYDIEIIPYAAEYKPILATQTAGGQKLPDILWRFRLGDDLINDYGEDGYFIDLTEYYEDKEKSANFWNMTDKYLTDAEMDRVWKMIHSDSRTADSEDSPIYVYPTLETTLVDTMDFMPLINTNWLKALNLEAPKTLDELVTVLKAFRDNDPNGNKIKDEIPMIGCTTSLGTGMLEWLINFFIYHDDAYNFNLDENGQLYLPYTQDKYREALSFINMLVEEGLLHNKTLTYGTDRLRTFLETSECGVTVAHPSLCFQNTSNTFLKYEALNLYGNVYYNSNQFYKDVFITDSCADPDAAWDLLMYMCTEESAFRLRYGELGVNWDWADEGATSVMGIPALVKVHDDIWGSVNNVTWNRLTGGVYPYSENEANQATGEETPFLKHKYEVYQDLRANYDAALAKVNKDLICPWLRFNEEEDEIAPYRSSLLKEVKSWRAHFIDGTKDPENPADWNEYINVLKTAGLDNYLVAAQMCYERMYKSGT